MNCENDYNDLTKKNYFALVQLNSPSKLSQVIDQRYHILECDATPKQKTAIRFYHAQSCGSFDGLLVRSFVQLVALNANKSTVAVSSGNFKDF